MISQHTPIAHAVGVAASVSVTGDAPDEITRVQGNQAQAAYQTARPNLIGSMIDGKYRIDGKLGAGGMGTVYRATRLFIGDQVAIKILHPEHVAQSQSMERFRREANAAARLKHPNAVSIYDFGVNSDGLVYLVMELVEGQSLRQIIKQQGPLTPSASFEIISQVCAALQEAHNHQVVHRDLKPDNIIVNSTQNGLRTKVLDFGIAKLRDLDSTNLTQTGSVMGTPHYMSPEQCLGEELDSRSDIYSVGVVLFEMLTGVVPFNSPTATAVVVQHVSQAAPSLRSINLSISSGLERVVLHALEKKREARPQTALALAEEFKSAIGVPPSQIPLVVGPVSQPESPPTVVMRTPVSGTTPPVLGQIENVSGVSKRALVVPLMVGAAFITLLIGVAVYFTFFSFSAKAAVLQEIKKENLVKPEGNSAYDLYLKYKQKDLSTKDKEEIMREAVPRLEQRGEAIFTGLKQDQTESEEQWSEAARIYSFLNDLKPNDTDESRIYFSQASLAFARKDYNAALSGYQRATKLQPNWSLALNRLGRVYLNLKDRGSAREYYRQATVAEPTWISPWLNFAGVCLDLNDPYSAEPALRQAISIDAQKASAHYLLAQSLEKQGRLCEAFQEYSVTSDLISRNPVTTVNSDALRRKITALNSQSFCSD